MQMNLGYNAHGAWKGLYMLGLKNWFRGISATFARDNTVFNTVLFFLAAFPQNNRS